MMTDPDTDVTHQELTSVIKSIQENTLFSGVSIICRSLRARGIRVTRERVHTTMCSIDPPSSALRWPAGATKRHPYSVAGPNSLWHIGR